MYYKNIKDYFSLSLSCHKDSLDNPEICLTVLTKRKKIITENTEILIKYSSLCFACFMQKLNGEIRVYRNICSCIEICGNSVDIKYQSFF